MKACPCVDRKKSKDYYINSFFVLEKAIILFTIQFHSKIFAEKNNTTYTFNSKQVIKRTLDMKPPKIKKNGSI